MKDLVSDTNYKALRIIGLKAQILTIIYHNVTQ